MHVARLDVQGRFSKWLVLALHEELYGLAIALTYVSPLPHISSASSSNM